MKGRQIAVVFIQILIITVFSLVPSIPFAQTEQWPQNSRQLDYTVWYNKERPTTTSMVYIPRGEYPVGVDAKELRQHLGKNGFSEKDIGKEIASIGQPGGWGYLPKKRIHLEPFYILEHEVCNKQYLEFCDRTGHNPPRIENDLEDSWPMGQLFGWHGRSYPPGRAGFPVIGIEEEDAVAFCEWLSEWTGIKHRLPTEEEWEATLRGKNGNYYPWGNEWNRQLMVAIGRSWIAGPDPFFDHSTDDITPLGVKDLFGNVAEYTTTKAHEQPEEAFVIRGFSYAYKPNCLGGIQRNASPFILTVGFRYVISVKNGKLEPYVAEKK